MVYVLNGGPRSGQLVDDLPVGYAPIDDPVRGPIQLFDGFEAEAAKWNPMAAAQKRWRVRPA